MKRAIACLVIASIAGCAGDPLRAPDVPQTPQYTSTPLAPQEAVAGVHGGQAQALAVGADIPAQWWTLFRSPALDGLVRQALDASPTLAAASAKLRQAE